MSIKRILNVTNELGLFFDDSNCQHLLRSLKFFQTGDVLHTFSAKEYVNQPTYLSVQVSEENHIHLFPEFLQYINHSCLPNVFFDTLQWQIVAIKDIVENEELVCFYPSTEWSMTQPFDCFCNTTNCLGKIEGASKLDSNSISKYHFNQHIQNKLKHKK